MNGVADAVREDFSFGLSGEERIIVLEIILRGEAQFEVGIVSRTLVLERESISCQDNIRGARQTAWIGWCWRR